MSSKRPPWRKIFWALAAAVLAAHLLNAWICSRTALPDFPKYFLNSDLYANWLWSQNILEQGWWDVKPYHPYTDWMQEIAPYDQWVKWWQGEVIFQHSPLYVYLLALWLKSGAGLAGFYFAQAVVAAALCVVLGRIAAAVCEDERAGVLAIALAGAYGPFYGYAVALLRDLLGWTITAASIWSLVAWCRQTRRGIPTPGVSLTAGLLLGVGVLARETFYLILPVAAYVLAAKCRDLREYRPLLFFIFGILAGVSPLLIRNAVAGAPVFSSSTRFAENFIEGNAPGAKPAAFAIPPDMGIILRRADGDSWRVVRETFHVYDGHKSSWIGLQIRKAAALFDPYEAPDNLSLYYLGEITPFVRFGLPHWLLIVPGLGGLALALRRRDRRHAWLGIFGIVLAASVALGPILSRYRQALAVLWIPWAASFLLVLFDAARANQKKRLGWGAALTILGWLLCLGPLRVRNPDSYFRATEYRLAAKIYDLRGDRARATQVLENLYKKGQSSR
ncbi:MAG: glycosyltransferase family 39 protein [Verrucomicrobiae bacterium]|nr:glycosyltransferase family 39 protein [Verrucomicrobiae bacterium]